MEYIQLKNTDLFASRLCMGCCPMGQYDWGITNEEDFIEAIHTALDLGVNFFDTADTYGLGQSELTLAKGLRTHRSEVIIQTKFGVIAGQGKTRFDNSPQYIRKALDNSLRRLKTDYIDLYVIHYYDYSTPVSEIFCELEKQKEAGKIRHFGISNVPLKDMEDWAPFSGKIVTAQYEFSLACRLNEPEIKTAEKVLGCTPMTWGSLGQGILTGKYDKNVSFGSNDRRRKEIYKNFHGEKLASNLKIVEYLSKAASVHQKTCASASIRFILDYLENSVAIVGAKNAHQMKENVSCMDWHLDEMEMTVLNGLSL